MIQNEILSDGRIRHFSDTGYKIRQVETDVVYTDAVDVIPCRYTYIETDELIEIIEPSDINSEQKGGMINEYYKQYDEITRT